MGHADTILLDLVEHHGLRDPRALAHLRTLLPRPQPNKGTAGPAPLTGIFRILYDVPVE